MKHPELVALGEIIRHYRMVAGLSQEEMAAQCGLHRTYIGGIERGERNVGVRNLIHIAKILQLHPSQLLMPIDAAVTTSRQVDNAMLLDANVLAELGLSMGVIQQAIEHVYQVLDAIDQTLIQNNQPRLSRLVELANLSAIIGNLFRAGFVNASNGAYVANAPHSYPDLVASAGHNNGIEIHSHQL